MFRKSIVNFNLQNIRKHLEEPSRCFPSLPPSMIAPLTLLHLAHPTSQPPSSISPCLHPGLLILHAGSAVETGTDSVAAIWAIYPHLGAISPHLSSANLSLKDGSAINCISLVFLSWSRNLVAARFLPLFSLLHPPQWVDPPHPLVSFLTEQYPPTCSQHLHLQMWIMQIHKEIISGSSTLTWYWENHLICHVFFLSIVW